jgi:hypothetical protein
VLQKEYGYVGYFLYVTLLAGVVSGLGVGVLMPFRKIGSLFLILPAIQKHLALVALLSYLLFTAASVYRMISTDFTLGLF